MKVYAVICGINPSMTDFWKRVRSLYNQDLNQAWLCRKLGMSSGSFSNWITRGFMPKADTAQIIAESLGVSVEYLVTGKDSYVEEFLPEKLLDSNLKGAAYVMDHKKPHSPHVSRSIPFYNVDLTYSNIQQIQDRSLKPTENLLYTSFAECDFCIRAVGDSMEPKIAHGDIVALQKLQNLRDVLWGEIYVVITFEESKICTLKSLFQDPENPDTVILRSLNLSKSGDNFLPKSTIKDIYKVVGSVRQFLF